MKIAASSSSSMLWIPNHKASPTVPCLVYAVFDSHPTAIAIHAMLFFFSHCSASRFVHAASFLTSSNLSDFVCLFNISTSRWPLLPIWKFQACWFYSSDDSDQLNLALSLSTPSWLWQKTQLLPVTLCGGLDTSLSFLLISGLAPRRWND